MSEVKYYTEEELVEKVQSGKFTMLDYVNHHSPEMSEDFKEYCQKKGLDSSSLLSAQSFLDEREKEFSDAMSEGNA